MGRVALGPPGPSWRRSRFNTDRVLRRPPPAHDQERARAGLYNGDTGVVVSAPDGSAVAVFATGSGPRDYSPWILEGLESVDAMTIHKSQGSQFAHVSIVLPPSTSPLLTRELLYTAVTRARESVVIVGEESSVRQAIENPTRRASGLATRL